MELHLPREGDVTWSVAVRSSGGMPLSSLGADVPLRTASVGKILLLVETARAIAAGELSPALPLTRRPEDSVHDSGLWHTLAVDTLPVADIAALIGAVSDNLATNVLLRKVTLAAVASSAAYLGLHRTVLHDRVRDVRGPSHPSTLSTGTAGELSDLAWRIEHGEAMSTEADRLVRQWLSGNVDQSMVGAAFVERLGLDPIAHHVSSGERLSFWNKTGTDAGVRADGGAATLGARTVAWAAVANWNPSAHDERTIASVLSGMHTIGEAAVAALCP